MTATTAPAANRVAGDPVVGLIEAYRERGDRRAVEQILSMNVKILNHIVRRYAASSDEPYEDLLQVGYVGMMKAVNGYRLDSEAKFSSYAYAMIEGEIKHHLRDTVSSRDPVGRAACTPRSPRRLEGSLPNSAVSRSSRRLRVR